MHKLIILIGTTYLKSSRIKGIIIMLAVVLALTTFVFYAAFSTKAKVSVALLTFEEFLTPEEIEGMLLDKGMSVEQIFISVPGETGRALIEGQPDQSIRGCIEAGMQDILEEFDPVTEEGVYQWNLNLLENYEVFAIMIEGERAMIAKLVSASGVGQVDFFDNPGENSPRVVPEKPDGTD